MWRHDRITEFIKNNFNASACILEMGPSKGGLLRDLWASGYKNIRGVDKENYIRFPEVQDKLTVVNLNHQVVPLPDISYDVIVALQILEHLENPWHFKRECLRLLKPGGALILSMPYGHNFASKIRFFLAGNVMRYEKSRDRDHISFFTKNVFDKLFEEFKLERIDYTEPNLHQFYIPLKLPNTRLLKKLFSHNIYYFFRKI